MKRISFLDNVRTFAIFSVVFCHCIEFIFDGEPTTIESPIMINFSVILFNFSRIGVPLFLLLSGYLLLDKEYKTEKDVYDFWKRKVLPIVITWVIWIVFFYCFKCWHDGIGFSIKTCILNILMVDRVKFVHDWYMYMLIGLYCIYPFVSMFLKRFSIKMHIFVFGMLYLVCMLLPTLASTTGKNFNFLNAVASYLINPNAYFILYCVLGYYLKKNEKLSFNLPVNIIGFLISISAIILCGYYRHSIMLSYYIWYDFALLPFASIFFFNLIRGLKLPSFIEKINGRISVCSFGMYLVHVPVLCLLIRFLPDVNITKPLLCIFYLVVTFVTSYLLVEVIGRVKYINKYLFMIKK